VGRGDSIAIRIVNVELRSAVQMLSQYLDRPVLFNGNPGSPVTFETPLPVPRRDVLRMLRGLVESQGLELFDDSTAGLYRVRPKEVPRPSPTVGSPSVRPPSGVELFVLPLKHARAVDVASTVNALYGRGSTGVESSARVPTLSDDLRSNLMPPVGAAAGQGPGGAPGGRPATLSGELTIVADSRGNSLLVRANAQDIELIRAVVDALDVRPLQVLIEVMVAEVRRDRSIGINVEGAESDGDRRGGPRRHVASGRWAR
jgi:general secretion pathway protein D